jgi:hypothetical protein
MIFGLYSCASFLTWSKSISQFVRVLYLMKLNTLDKNVTGAQCVRCHQCDKSIPSIVSPGSIRAAYIHTFAAAPESACTLA